MPISTILNMRTEFEDITENYNMNGHAGSSINSLNWFVENGHKSNSLRNGFDNAKEIADALAKKYDISREYAIERANEETDSSNTYLEFAKNLEFEFQEMANDGGHQRYDEPMFDDDGMRKLRHQEESVKPKKKPFLKEQLERFGGGKY